MFKILLSVCILIQVINSQVIGNIYNQAAYGPALAGPGIAGPGLPGPGLANVVTEAAIANTLAHNPAIGYNAPYEALAPVHNIPGLTYGMTLSELSASKGPGLRVTSSSPIAPTGIAVESDKMVMEGPVTVTGQLPFLGVVSMEGPLPAAGHGAVAYGCGNGNVGIVNEGPEIVQPNLAAIPQGYAPLQPRLY